MNYSQLMLLNETRGKKPLNLVTPALGTELSRTNCIKRCQSTTYFLIPEEAEEKVVGGYDVISPLLMHKTVFVLTGSCHVPLRSLLVLPLGRSRALGPVRVLRDPHPDLKHRRDAGIAPRGVNHDILVRSPRHCEENLKSGIREIATFSPHSVLKSFFLFFFCENKQKKERKKEIYIYIFSNIDFSNSSQSSAGKFN